jgi:hypothetical protein
LGLRQAAWFVMVLHARDLAVDEFHG